MSLDSSSLSRRRFLAASALVAGSAWLAPHGLFAEEKTGVVQMMRNGAASAELATQPVRGGVHLISGSGGNIGVFPGPQGALLVDAGLAGSKPRLVEMLQTLGADPVSTVINTHWHFDHTDGNLWLHNSGAVIMAHENTLRRMQTTHTVPAWDFTFPPAPEGALPEVSLKIDRSLRVNGKVISVRALAPSHTDGDLVVHFTDADVFHLGDTFWNGHYPFIDTSSGGSIDGMIRATRENLAAIGEKSLIIPGHGPLADKPALQRYLDMLVDVREKIAALKQAGRTLAEVVEARPSAAYDEQWGDFVINPATFAALVYEGV